MQFVVMTLIANSGRRPPLATLSAFGTPTMVHVGGALTVSAIMSAPWRSLATAATAPLLCGGITTYSPLRHWRIGEGNRVGIVGLGGLGHLGAKLARAFGADDAVVSSDPDAMRKHAGSFDFILDTVSGEHDIDAYLNLLRRDGNLTLVGAPAKPLAVSSFGLIGGRKSLSGSNIGGIAETQEMLDFCGARNIAADVEIIPIQRVNEAFERLLRSDVKYRFVIDIASLRSEVAPER